MALDHTPRYTPSQVMTARGMSPVVSARFYPPGTHKGSPIVARSGALELVTASGHARWYGVRAASINSRLRMVVAGFPAQFEEMARWKRVPARDVPPQLRAQLSLFGSRSRQSRR